MAECEANIATVNRLLAIADRLDGDNRLGEALGSQDAVASQRIVNEALIGSGLIDDRSPAAQRPASSRRKS